MATRERERESKSRDAGLYGMSALMSVTAWIAAAGFAAMAVIRLSQGLPWEAVANAVGGVVLAAVAVRAWHEARTE